MSETDSDGGVVCPQDSDETLRSIYGDEAMFSRVGRFTLVHLDNPSPEELNRRVVEFDPNQFFFDECPLCKSAKESGGHIVFDNYSDPDDDELPDWDSDDGDDDDDSISLPNNDELLTTRREGERSFEFRKEDDSDGKTSS